MKTYEVYIEGYYLDEGIMPAEYLGRYTGSTFTEAARQACVDRYGEKDTNLHFSIRGGIPCIWCCRLYDNFMQATHLFG